MADLDPSQHQEKRPLSNLAAVAHLRWLHWCQQQALALQPPHNQLCRLSGPPSRGRQFGAPAVSAAARGGLCSHTPPHTPAAASLLPPALHACQQLCCSLDSWLSGRRFRSWDYSHVKYYEGCVLCCALFSVHKLDTPFMLSHPHGNSQGNRDIIYWDFWDICRKQIATIILASDVESCSPRHPSNVIDGYKCGDALWMKQHWSLLRHSREYVLFMHAETRSRVWKKHIRKQQRTGWRRTWPALEGRYN